MFDYSKKKPLIFDYKEATVTTRESTETIIRPMMLVKIGYDGKKITMPALIDTGSDKTLCYMNPFGKMLGIDIDEFEGEPDQIRGLFGTGHAWCKHVNMWVGDKYFNIPIFWITEPFDIKQDYQLIIGRKIIFDNFDVLFKQKDKKVYFFSNKE